MSSSFDFTIAIWQKDTQSELWMSHYKLGQLYGNKHAFFCTKFFSDYNMIISYNFIGSFFVWKIEKLNRTKFGKK